MKKTINSLVLAGLMVSVAPVMAADEAPKAESKGFFASMQDRVDGWKNWANEFAEKAIFNEAVRRGHESLPEFLKGDSKIDSLARFALLSSALYLGVKPFLKDNTGANTVALGLLGHVFDLLNVDKCEIRGRNVAEDARAKKEELNAGFRKMFEGYFARKQAADQAEGAQA